MFSASLKRRTAAIFTVSAFAAALVLPAAAAAHTSVSPTEAEVDGYAKLTFTVPHGCDGASTTKLIVQIPDGVSSVTPGVVPGWKISTKEGPLAEPVDNHGETITEGIREVTWTGGPLPDHYLQDFPMSVKFDGGAPGDVRYFKAIQECEGGGEAAWIEEPAAGQDPHELDMPAPAVTLVAAAGDDHHAAGGDDHADTSDEGTAGNDNAAAEAASGDGDGNGGDTKSTIALILGAVGALLGGASFLRGRK